MQRSSATNRARRDSLVLRRVGTHALRHRDGELRTSTGLMDTVKGEQPRDRGPVSRLRTSTRDGDEGLRRGMSDDRIEGSTCSSTMLDAFNAARSRRDHVALRRRLRLRGRHAGLIPGVRRVRGEQLQSRRVSERASQRIPDVSYEGHGELCRGRAGRLTTGHVRGTSASTRDASRGPRCATSGRSAATRCRCVRTRTGRSIEP